MNSNPKLSLVTGKVGRDESFQRMVDSVLKHTSVSYELVVVDASPEPYISTNPNIRVIHEKPRETHSRGYNRGFMASRGEFIIWINDDAEVCAGYDVAAIDFMEAHPEIGLGALHYSEDGGPFHVNAAYRCIYANFGIFRKFVGESVGYFDEDIHMYGADNSLALRVLLQNYGIADIPDARVIHHSVKDQLRIDNQYWRRRDNETLTRKYMPEQRRWVATFNRLYVPSGLEPWSHGTRPKMVYA